MSLGDSTLEAESAGGEQVAGGPSVDKSVVVIGVSTIGAANEVIRCGSASGISRNLGLGPLAEAVARYRRGGRTVYAIPADPTADGKKGAVTHVGIDDGTVVPSLAPHVLITVMCVTGGALGTATFKFSVDGGVTYGALFTSTITSYVIRVPGTMCTLTFAAATYVATKTLTVATNGTVTPGTLWVGTVTQASSPIDNYDFKITVLGDGALGAFSIRVSPDGGVSSYPDLSVPSGGVVVIPNTGVVLTLANTFTEGETYSFLCCAAGFSTTELSNALAAMVADQALAATLVHVVHLPASASAAFSAGAVVNDALLAAYANDKIDMQGLVECPRVGDNVVSGGNAIADTADTDAVIRTARIGQDWKRCALAAGTHRMTSRLGGGTKLKRPTGWALADRFVDTDPKEDLSRVATGPLAVYAIGIDEAVDPGLDEVQINVLQTRRGRNGAFLAITDGGFGYKHLTTDASFQSGGAVRVLNTFSRALRNVQQALLGEDAETNADGTISKGQAGQWTTRVDAVGKRSVGLLTGGAYPKRQASTASASVLESSQLGQSPRRLEIEYDLQTRGFVSAVHGVVRFGGTLT